MNNWEQLSRAISIATAAHENQFDKAGKPYILHPLYLMNQLLFDPELAAVAVLHDVLEDSDFTLEVLRSIGFSIRILTAVNKLTHNPDDTYQEYIDKIATNIDAIRVKRKDLEHNCLVTRLKGIQPKDLARIEKYHRAFIQLGEAKRDFKQNENR